MGILVIVIDALVESQDAANTAAANAEGASSEAAGQQEVGASADGPFGPESFLAEWVFAVLTFVEEPLVDDIQYNLQRLRRTCQKAITAADAQSKAGGGVVDSNA